MAETFFILTRLVLLLHWWTWQIENRYNQNTLLKLIYDRFIQVSESDIEDMFTFADKDNDGKISYKVYFSIINWIAKILQCFFTMWRKKKKKIQNEKWNLKN